MLIFEAVVALILLTTANPNKTFKDKVIYIYDMISLDQYRKTKTYRFLLVTASTVTKVTKVTNKDFNTILESTLIINIFLIDLFNNF